MNRGRRAWWQRRHRRAEIAAFCWGVVACGLAQVVVEHIAGVSKMMGW